jgi:serine/threonine-protein kinase
VSTATGAVVTLAEGADARGASWGSQGAIVFAPTRTSVLHEVSDAGGSVRALTKFSAMEGSHRWPEFLPGGKMLLFAALRSGSNWEQATIAVHSVDTGERRDLIEGGSHPRYTPSGHLVYVRGQTLMAAPFDIERLAVTGAGVPVVEGVMPSPPLSGMAQYSFSTTGALVYLPGSIEAFQRQLVWVNRIGTEQPLNAPPRPYRNPRIAPDGQRVAVAIEEQQMHVWVYDLARDALTRLTTEGGLNYNPVWSADGQHIGFTAFGRPDQGFFRQRVDGSGALERLCCEAGDWPATSWSPDGQIAVGSGATGDLHVWRPGDRNVTPLARTPFVEGAGMFSPDGRWIAYASDESGRVEIYVRAYPGPGVRAQISTNGGTEPTWNRNGRELFYREGSRMMSAPIAGGPNFSAGRPTILFEGQYEPSLVGYANYDVSPDGQRFLMLKAGAAAETEPTQINVVLNWFEDLKRRVVPN